MDQFRNYRMIQYLEKSNNPPTSEHLEFKQRIDRIIVDLPEMEKTLVWLRYLDPNADYIKDYEVMEQMQICRPTFVKIRTAAFRKLAPAMGIQIDKLGARHD
jgi:predicted DNA-binding protein (UPF0251 family)